MIRKIDYLGKVVIPFEIREKIFGSDCKCEDMNVSIYEKDGNIILKPVRFIYKCLDIERMKYIGYEDHEIEKWMEEHGVDDNTAEDEYIYDDCGGVGHIIDANALQQYLENT